jgi:DNA-binding beta-propeller fold protein YncE
MTGDRLYEWLRQNTKPTDTFVSEIYILHPILLSGRRLYFGYPTFSWSAGYDVGSRQPVYREMLTTRSPRELVRRLQANDIAYVAIDDGLRNQAMVAELNESVYREHLEIAFDDADNRYANLVVFRVPDDPTAWQGLPDAPPVDAFSGGPGSGPGRFDGPRGIGLGPGGLIAVADTRNHRVQLFEPDGTFRAELGEAGTAGAADGQFNEPGGVALDAAGHVYVADTLNHRLVELDAAGGVVDVWTGPEPGFYGPRDVTVGPDGDIYVLDQGRARVVRRAADGSVTSYGSFGTGDGQLSDPTGLAVDATRLYVADTGNARIVVFELSGEFVTALAVDEWNAPFIFPDVAVDGTPETLVYASSPASGEVLAFNSDGRRLGSFGGDAEFMRPGSLAVADDGSLLVVDEGGNRIVVIDPTSAAPPT